MKNNLVIIYQKLPHLNTLKTIDNYPEVYEYEKGYVLVATPSASIVSDFVLQFLDSHKDITEIINISSAGSYSKEGLKLGTPVIPQFVFNSESVSNNLTRGLIPDTSDIIELLEDVKVNSNIQRVNTVTVGSIYAENQKNLIELREFLNKKGYTNPYVLEQEDFTLGTICNLRKLTFTPIHFISDLMTEEDRVLGLDAITFTKTYDNILRNVL